MISGDMFNKNVMRDEIIVCDWDGVIQDIDFYWMKKLTQEREKYEPYFDFSKLMNEEGQYDFATAWDREIYYMNKWLQKSDVKKVPKEITDDFVKMYIDDMSFYMYCPFLVMADSLLNISDQKFIKHIYFLSSAPSGYDVDPRKMIMMNKFFGKNNSKVSLVIINGNTPKSEYINKHLSNYTVFIDDRSDVIRDVIANTDSNNKQFIMPLTGYNKELIADQEYIKECDTKNILISSYLNQVLNDR